MKKLSLFLFAILILGCGDDPPKEVTEPLPEDVGPASATKVVIDPSPKRSRNYGPPAIWPDTEFTLTFNHEVVAVIINGIPATGSGLHWKWSTEPHLVEGKGPITLKIMWTNRNGSRAFAKAGPYIFVWGHEAPPSITVGTVMDGETDVDPAPINVSGFQFDFDEEVRGTIKLTDEVGVDRHWIGHVEGQTATLTPIPGQELVNGTTYKIEIDVRDPGDWQTQVTLSFVTKIK